MEQKYLQSGIIGLLIIISVSSTLYISDYRAILDSTPSDGLALLDYSTEFNRLELLTHLSPPDQEFTRFLYRDDYIKVYYGRDLVAQSYWKVFQGSSQVVFNDINPIRWEENNGRVFVVMNKQFFADSRHTSPVGNLTREIEVYPSLNKETITWTPVDDSVRYGLRWETETDYTGLAEDFLAKNMTSTLGYPIISWEDSKELVSSARRFDNGKVRIIYSTNTGKQVIDPEIISAERTNRSAVISDTVRGSKERNFVYCTVDSYIEDLGNGVKRARIGGTRFEKVNGECVPSASLINITSQDDGVINVSYHDFSFAIIPVYDTGSIVDTRQIKRTVPSISSAINTSELEYGKRFDQSLNNIPKSFSDTVVRTGYRVENPQGIVFSTDGTVLMFDNGVGVDFSDFSKGQNISVSKEGEIYVSGFKSDLDPTVIFGDPDTEILDDTYFTFGSSESDDDRGAAADVRIVNQTSSSSGDKKGAFKVNVSALLQAGYTDPDSIIAATFTIKGASSGLDTSEGFNVSVKQIYSYPTYTPSGASTEWTEGTSNLGSGCVTPELCGNTAPNSTVGYNETAEDIIYIDYLSDTAAHDFTVTQMLKRVIAAGEQNISIQVSASDPANNIGATDSVNFGSKENGVVGNRPYLTIDYSTAPTHDTPTLTPSSATPSDNLTVNNISTSDPNGDAVKNIYDFRNLSQSIAVLNMPFDGGSNTTFTKDYTSWDNNGVVTNLTWGSSNGFGGSGSYEFANADDYVTILNNTKFLFNNDTSDLPFTISLWANTNNPSATNVLVALDQYNGTWNGNRAWIFYTTATDIVFVLLNNDSSGSLDEKASYSFSSNQWYHLTVTYDGSRNFSGINIYVDGVLQAESSTTNNSYSGLGRVYSPLRIGGRVNDGSPPSTVSDFGFDGRLDEVMIFSRELSADQVYNLYANRTNQIASSETLEGDAWSACVTPNDGTGDGITKCSNEVTISAAASSCSPTASQDWVISDEQVCDAAVVSLPSNNIIIVSGGSLVCRGGSNITHNGIIRNGCGDNCVVKDYTSGCTIVKQY